MNEPLRPLDAKNSPSGKFLASHASYDINEGLRDLYIMRRNLSNAISNAKIEESIACDDRYTGTYYTLLIVGTAVALPILLKQAPSLVVFDCIAALGASFMAGREFLSARAFSRYAREKHKTIEDLQPKIATQTQALLDQGLAPEQIEADYKRRYTAYQARLA